MSNQPGQIFDKYSILQAAVIDRWNRQKEVDLDRGTWAASARPVDGSDFGEWVVLNGSLLEIGRLELPNEATHGYANMRRMRGHYQYAARHEVDPGSLHEDYIASLPCACGADEDNPCVCN